MPLLDHFHPPLSQDRHWESFHAFWSTILAERMNLDLLPERYYAEVQVHVGGRFEVDVAALEREPAERQGQARDASSSPVATAVAPARVWTPPRPDGRMPGIYPDIVEMLVFNGEAGPSLVGAVEFVSPGNKDRPEAQRAFAAKCASYLQEGIGLVVVDIVTNRRANLHNELVDLLGVGEDCRMPGDPPVYATAYRPIRRPSTEVTDVWMSRLAVGETLPTLPLALRGGPCLPVDLESTYAELRRRARIA